MYARVSSALAIVAIAGATSALATPCALDEVPAATLLIPYFDVSECPSEGSPSEVTRDTVFEVINTDKAATLTKVTLWSNAGVPVFDFDIYLAGYSRQGISLGALLCNGTLPSTGAGVSDHGQFSDSPTSFAGCNDTPDPGNGAPVYGGDGAVSEAERTRIRTELLGQSANGTSCAALPSGNGLANGYITIDSVSECGSLTPADSGYYGIISHNNRLTGNVHLVDRSLNSQASFPAVAIESAEPGVFAAGDVTFYGRYNGRDASDRREPLPTTYFPRLIDAGAYDAATLLVWRESNGDASRFSCTGGPSWHPLGLSNTTGQDNQAVFEIDESGVGGRLGSSPEFPLATQAVDTSALGLKSSSSALWMNLQHDGTVYAGNPPDRFGQAWVGTITTSPGRFSEGISAAAIDSSCTNADFDATSPGPRIMNPPTL